MTRSIILNFCLKL